MVKKIITAGLVLVWLSSVAFAGYRIFEPTAAQSVEDQRVSLASVDALGRSVDNSSDLPVVAAHTLEQNDEQNDESEEDTEEIHYYFFCEPEDADCIYVNDYVLKSLAAALEVEQIEILEYVDISTLSTEWTPQRLKNQWGFDDYPAFVATSLKKDGTKTILSVLQWNSDEPLDMDDLKNWMIDLGIWEGPVEEQGIPIEQPNS